MVASYLIGTDVSQIFSNKNCPNKLMFSESSYKSTTLFFQAHLDRSRLFSEPFSSSVDDENELLTPCKIIKGRGNTN